MGKELKDGEPCGHPGCLHHVTHPCEGCGRIAGRTEKPEKPRVRFCWLCGNKLRGNHHVEKVVDGHTRILHKSCAKGEYTPGNYDAMKECGIQRDTEVA